MMIDLYITKWVLARGILHVRAEKPERRMGCFRLRSMVNVPGLRYSQVMLIGREAFLTLEEAQEDAAQRFQTYLKQARKNYAYAKRASQLIQTGKGPVVHREFTAVNKCRAF